MKSRKTNLDIEMMTFKSCCQKNERPCSYFNHKVRLGTWSRTDRFFFVGSHRTVIALPLEDSCRNLPCDSSVLKTAWRARYLAFCTSLSRQRTRQHRHDRRKIWQQEWRKIFLFSHASSSSLVTTKR